MGGIIVRNCDGSYRYDLSLVIWSASCRRIVSTLVETVSTTDRSMQAWLSRFETDRCWSIDGYRKWSFADRRHAYHAYCDEAMEFGDLPDAICLFWATCVNVSVAGMTVPLIKAEIMTVTLCLFARRARRSQPRAPKPPKPTPLRMDKRRRAQSRCMHSRSLTSLTARPA